MKQVHRKWKLIIAAAATTAFLVKITIALMTLGTNDVLTWQEFLRASCEMAGIDLYHRVTPFDGDRPFLFNHPPFMIHVLRLIGLLVNLTGLPFPFWIRMPAIVADAGSLWLTWKILSLGSGAPRRPASLALMAICPASILISGFHGNTDPVMIFFVLLSVYLLQLNRPMTWLAGLAFGMSMNIKVLPLMFIPALFWFLPNARRRIEFFGSAAAIFVTASLPYLVQDPFFVLVRVFLYRSIYGLWGLSRLFTELGAPASLNRLYGAMGAVGLLAGVTAISFRMNRAKKKPPLFLQFGLVMFFFMALTPGFGVQYLAWLAPWVVALGPWAALLYYCTSGIFLFLVYNYWTHGLPWYLADAHQAGWWHGYIVGFELLCWMSVIFLLIMLLRQVFPKPRPA